MPYRGKRDSADGVTAARLAGTASRYATGELLDVDAALAELRDIAAGREDLLAEVAARILRGAQDELDAGRWPTKVIEAALLIQAGADLTSLAKSIESSADG